MITISSLEIELIPNIKITMIKNLLGSLDSLIPHSSVRSNIVWSRSRIFIKSKSFKTQQKLKDFLSNRLELINLLWSLIFRKSNGCILEVQQDR